MRNFTEREQVVETVNRLFYYTDFQQWEKLIKEVFAEEVILDMTSLGAPAIETLTGKQICEMWKEGFKELDAIHHQSGNYIIDIEGDIASVKAYAIASHYKKNATKGTTREFIGSYDFRLVKFKNNWKIDRFTFNLKYMTGNTELN
ncbi:nuclear transport factor 2 family protein [Fulvivirga sp. 29W222]|uniref:Nuclear transport factor 2 family protein n=1 Tax=Fulvivirga marina TaxID=2494733 RepID=A0A937FY25_9BACT|nr:nuclear transport factor 2 family protein [Fulvivirga marina]MBL6448254.1 nuclear transport factor 2 family protein [Fulvivirga marina]